MSRYGRRARDERAPSKSVQIEQAIAFGRSLDWITEHLDATLTDINAAMHRLDVANGSVDDNDPEPGSGRADPTVLAELLDALVPRRSARQQWRPRDAAGRFRGVA